MPALPPKADICGAKRKCPLYAKSGLMQRSKSYDPRQAKPGGIVETKLSTASAGLGGRGVAGGDLVLVGGEGCQDFGLLPLWNLEEVQGPSEFRCDLIEFCG